MLDCDATSFDEEASHSMPQHCIVAAQAHAQLPLHPLNELLLVEETLSALCDRCIYLLTATLTHFVVRINS
jgi:hypothetical protein